MATGLNTAWLSLSEVCLYTVLYIVSVGKLGECGNRAKHCMVVFE